MQMTPRQIAAFLHFADRDEAIREARFIINSKMAAGADKKDLQEYLDDMVPE